MSRLLLSLALLLSGAASAEQVVFYRCTDGGGALTVQNMPCPAGSREEKRSMQAVSTVPMRQAAPATLASPSAAQTPDAAAGSELPVHATPAPLAPLSAAEAPLPAVTEAPVERSPPPHLFQCTTHERHTYITEDSAPQSRCVPLRTVGLDGNPATGAGQACEVRRDICARVPDETLCQSWTRRLGEVQVAARFGRAENAADNEAELVRVRRILAQSTCSE